MANDLGMAIPTNQSLVGRASAVAPVAAAPCATDMSFVIMTIAKAVISTAASNARIRVGFMGSLQFRLSLQLTRGARVVEPDSSRSGAIHCPPHARTSATTPKKHAMPMTITQSGLAIVWECGVAMLATGRLETRDESNAAGRALAPGMVVACDIAPVLSMRGQHNCRRVGTKRMKSRCRVDFGRPAAHYSRNAHTHTASAS